MEFEFGTLILSGLIILSIGLLRISTKFGVPSLLLFLVIGMAAGSDGLGGIEFDNPVLAKQVGSIALAYILFSGGLETEWLKIKPVLWKGIVLGNLGVLITGAVMGLFSVYVLGFSPIIGFLLGAVVSSTDAAAVFNVLRTRNTGMKKGLTSLLELESGSNDPLAVLLTVSILSLLGPHPPQIGELALHIFMQFSIGTIAGVIFGYAIYKGLNRIKLEYEGLYPVLISASVLFVYSATELIQGNPFLAVYIAGLVLGNQSFVHKRSNLRFLDGIAWLMQIIMFLTLGLLVYPSRIPPLFGTGIIFSLFLVFVARPIAVFVSLFRSGYNIREKLLVSWIGLRGAAPIILATFPFAQGLAGSDKIFHLVFFTVLVSLLLQGTSVPQVVRWLGLDAPLEQRASYPFEFENREQSDSNLLEFIVPYGSNSAGKFVYSLNFPENSLITLIYRGDRHIVPTGKTTLEEGDVLLILTPKGSEDKIRDILSQMEDTI
ncbi:potassium/proton antiporter [Leptospira mayottensis]|uniref:Transporter, CPA2 family n=2 Tax=Leptospira mayottensis TaxID=1137606 RepID=A0AA87SZC0_9LEPT|nr:potassium/proton antiporter [Leptospira mayottensis]AXR59731.1 potassium/proton antiporter [Leptospira mayottensis]AXR64022.1 potassium/proton antiporter [Leptospira mayottensis]AXR67272.1 potassium/proton antiporter [Leptospira mayottensis]AZQ00949.1 potassium/proton antiporter [Leptospira mayottensis 200901116]EKS00502.1 transporter, CPA2 family [Leptospira mayottensis 200901122]